MRYIVFMAAVVWGLLVPTAGAARPTYYAEFNGASSQIAVADNESLRDLHAGSFTVDAWIRNHNLHNEGGIAWKESTGFPVAGWHFLLDHEGQLAGWVAYDGSPAERVSTAYTVPETTWVHVLMTFNAADGLIHLAFAGVWSTYQEAFTKVAAGNPVSDAGQAFRIGLMARRDYYFDGDIAWLRISRGVRYPTGVDFTPPALETAPAVDSATVELWALDGGNPNVARAEVWRENNGAMTDVEWVRQ